jgi:anti-sigma B factor antagonist
MGSIMEDKNISVTVKPFPSIRDLKIITIKGTIDISTSKRIDKTILSVIEKGDSHIIIDLSQLDYLSSIGMMSLTNYVLRARAKMRMVKFIKPTKPIYDTMSVFGFTKRFDMYDNLEDAINTFR